MSAEARPALLVVDASIGLKWVVEEADSVAARSVAARHELCTPSLFWSEAANALSVMARAGRLTPEGAALALRDLRSVRMRTEESASAAAEAALDLGLRLGHPAYDCFYLALALARDAVVLTADRRFAAAAAAGPPEVARRVLLLSDAAAALTGPPLPSPRGSP